MSRMGSKDRLSAQVNGSNAGNNDSKAKYAIKWGEKIEITEDLIAQICPADLTDRVCEFDYVMPNGCDHNCEMLRLCEIYVAHCDYECPNNDGNDLPCPYVHGVPLSCPYVNRQFTILLEKKALEESLSKSWKSTLEEVKREVSNKKNNKVGNDLLKCTIKVAGDDCERGHDHQAARLVSYALLQKHQHAGRIGRGIEPETFDEKSGREAELCGTPPKCTTSEETISVPEGAALTLVVQSLAYATTEEALKAVFEKYGEVKRVNILKKDDGTSKGTGFIDFTKLEHAAKALNALQGFELDRRALKVKFKEDRGVAGTQGCFSCGQEGHISRDCPSKESNRVRRGGGYDAGQDQSVGAGWAGAEVNTTSRNDWAGGGETTAQNLTGDWDNVGAKASQSSAVSDQKW